MISNSCAEKHIFLVIYPAYGAKYGVDIALQFRFLNELENSNMHITYIALISNRQNYWWCSIPFLKKSTYLITKLLQCILSTWLCTNRFCSQSNGSLILKSRFLFNLYCTFSNDHGASKPFPLHYFNFIFFPASFYVLKLWQVMIAWGG